jgi:hypothetical protein
MAANHQETRIYQMPMDNIVAILRSPRFAIELNLEIKSENPTAEGVWYRFHHGMTMQSYGEKITVTLNARSDGSVQVIVYSECGMPTQVVDWGKNKSNVEIIFNYIEASLNQAPQSFGVPCEPIDQSNLYTANNAQYYNPQPDMNGFATNSFGGNAQFTVEEEPPQPCKGLAIASMILGFLSFMFYGFLTGVLSVIFAIVAKANGNKSRMATTGLVCSICSMAFWTLVFVLVAVFA